MNTLSLKQGLTGRVLAVIALFSLVASLMPMQAFAASAINSLNISPTLGDECLVIGTEITVSGNATAEAPPGQLRQYHVLIDWGDSTTNSATEVSAFGTGNQQGTASRDYGADHTYSTAGNYTITVEIYHANTPGNDNQADAVRTLDICVVEENTKPVITLNGNSTINLSVGGTYTELGATADDVEDGQDIVVTNITGTVNTAVAGTYTVKYNFTDSDGAAADEVSRTVIVSPVVVENTPPVITLTGLSTVNLTVGDSYTELGATADDVEDGQDIVVTNITGTVNTAVAGTYTVKYNFTDSNGAAASEVSRTVIVNTDNDIDDDTVLNDVDNCPTIANLDQLDTDMDGIGDACDNDADNDTILDGVDNCVNTPNTDQADNDADGIGNVCDATPDGDGGGDPVTCEEPTAQNFGEEAPCVYFVSQCPAEPANLLVNGSFEDPVADANPFGTGFYEVFSSITGWTAANGIELWNNILNGSSDLAQSTELDVNPGDVGPSTMSQTVVTIPGATYELSFDFAARDDNSALVENSVVAAADAVTVSKSTSNTAFVTYGTTFTADGSTDISFTDAGTDNGVGTVIDNANLCLVRLPEDNGGDNDELSCTITVDNSSIRRGRDVNVTWDSTNAVSAMLNGETVDLDGTQLFENLREDTTYTLTVSDGEVTEDCSVSVNTTSGGGGGGGSIGDRDDDDDQDGEVLGDSDDAPEGEVLGDQVSTIPTGAPNAGDGGTSPFAQTFFGIVPVAFARRTKLHG